MDEYGTDNRHVQQFESYEDIIEQHSFGVAVSQEISIPEDPDMALVRGRGSSD